MKRAPPVPWWVWWGSAAVVVLYVLGRLDERPNDSLASN